MKGKDEREVGYVKRNAIAGRRSRTGRRSRRIWTGERARLPISVCMARPARLLRSALPKRLGRFALWGTGAVWAAAGSRAQVQADCAIDLDTNSYPVSSRLIGESVQVVVLGGRVIVRHAGEVVADHALCGGRRQRIVERAHLAGRLGAAAPVQLAEIVAPSALLRPLAEYEALVGGSWGLRRSITRCW